MQFSLNLKLACCFSLLIDFAINISPNDKKPIPQQINNYDPISICCSCNVCLVMLNSIYVYV